MSTSRGAAEISVVIPTYNRAGMLRRTLRALLAQRMPPDTFDVIVADDGSSDSTREVVDEFRPRLRLLYHFQEDLGFRAAAARNAGARLATAPIVVFADTGTLAGPDFLRAHLEAHAGHTPRAVIGYMFGCRPFHPTPGLEEAVATMSPEEIADLYGYDPIFLDCRHEMFAELDFEIGRGAAPWHLFWTSNCSIPAEDFWAVGGFDERFVGWGGEDLDLGLRLYHRGVPFHLSSRAWGIDSPHERDFAGRLPVVRGNMLAILHKHPEPSVEMSWASCDRDDFWRLERDHRALTEWAERARRIDTATALTRELRSLASGTRTAVFGCGDMAAVSPPATYCFDFDRAYSTRTEHGTEVRHAIGIRTTLPDQSVDVVIVTSRLRGLWDRWGSHILYEAHRIGRAVRLLDVDDGPTR